MAKKKKKHANRPKPVAAPSTDKLAKDKAEFEASVEAAKEKTEAASKKETKTSDKEKEKAKGKDKGKTVVKARAKDKDPKKANKKPNIFRRFADYVKQVRLEIKRTTWPTGNEVLNMTIIVLVALLFFGTFIFLIDQAMVRLLNLYGHLVPTVDLDMNALVDGLGDGADLEELESELQDGTPAVRFIRGLDLSSIWAFFGGK